MTIFREYVRHLPQRKNRKTSTVNHQLLTSRIFSLNQPILNHRHEFYNHPNNDDINTAFVTIVVKPVIQNLVAPKEDKNEIKRTSVYRPVDETFSLISNATFETFFHNANCSLPPANVSVTDGSRII